MFIGSKNPATWIRLGALKGPGTAIGPPLWVRDYSSLNLHEDWYWVRASIRTKDKEARLSPGMVKPT